MAGGPKSKGKKRSKWRKLRPKKEHVLLQEEEEVGSSQPETPPQAADNRDKKKRKKRSSKKVHLSPLPDKYDPLEEGVAEEEAESKEDKKYRRKQKVKKYAKNVGKAVRASCRYLMIGLQGLATAYISPFNTTTVMMGAVPR